MQNANECRHEYKQGFALVPTQIRADRADRAKQGMTISYSDFLFGLRSCLKCHFCGKSVGGDVKHGS